MTTHAIFESPERLEDAFNAGLARLLEHEGLGAFILVLANATFDAAVFDDLAPALRSSYGTWASRYRDALKDGRMPADAPDDADVFLKLLALGFEELRMTEYRRAGPWELQFNHLRAFRPKRMTAARAHGVGRPFDPSEFNFNRPILKKEVFWQGDLCGRDAELFYNKFPFARRHALLVPTASANRPQILVEDDHLFAWTVASTLGDGLPGVGIAYNAYGAFASVNHLHFQLFMLSRPLPVMLPEWRHNGGARSYPATCDAFDSPREAWSAIAGLHRARIPYNLIYLPGRLYCMPRLSQGSYAQPDWTAGFAWYEMSGGVVLSGRSDFECLTAQDMTRALTETRIPP